MLPTLPVSIQHSTQSSSQSNKTAKEIKGIEIGKEEVKVSLFADDMIEYISNLHNSTRELLWLTNNFSKINSKKISIPPSGDSYECENPISIVYLPLKLHLKM